MLPVSNSTTSWSWRVQSARRLSGTWSWRCKLMQVKCVTLLGVSASTRDVYLACFPLLFCVSKFNDTSCIPLFICYRQICCSYRLINSAHTRPKHILFKARESEYTDSFGTICQLYGVSFVAIWPVGHWAWPVKHRLWFDIQYCTRYSTISKTHNTHSLWLTAGGRPWFALRRWINRISYSIIFPASATLDIIYPEITYIPSRVARDRLSAFFALRLSSVQQWVTSQLSWNSWWR